MQRPERVQPEMNVTPLVDVVLVLLIIFMVIVPQMQAGAAVNLPGVRHPDAKTSIAAEPVTVTVTASGALYLEKQAMGRTDLLAELTRLRARAPGRRLILKADQALRYEVVRTLFRDCSVLGWPGMSLQVGDKRAEVEEARHGL